MGSWGRDEAWDGQMPWRMYVHHGPLFSSSMTVENAVDHCPPGEDVAARGSDPGRFSAPFRGFPNNDSDDDSERTVVARLSRKATGVWITCRAMWITAVDCGQVRSSVRISPGIWCATGIAPGWPTVDWHRRHSGVVGIAGQVARLCTLERQGNPGLVPPKSPVIHRIPTITVKTVFSQYFQKIYARTVTASGTQCWILSQRIPSWRTPSAPGHAHICVSLGR